LKWKPRTPKAERPTQIEGRRGSWEFEAVMSYLLSSLGCGNDLVEALITAQRIPARIKAEVGYDGTAGIFATFFAAA